MADYFLKSSKKYRNVSKCAKRARFLSRNHKKIKNGETLQAKSAFETSKIVINNKKVSSHCVIFDKPQNSNDGNYRLLKMIGIYSTTCRKCTLLQTAAAAATIAKD